MSRQWPRASHRRSHAGAAPVQRLVAQLRQERQAAAVLRDKCHVLIAHLQVTVALGHRQRRRRALCGESTTP